jgi:hypothetical protein
MFQSMTVTDFVESIKPKQIGTWNLHNVALECGINLDFFTMLSSICGVIGQAGQANYSAGNSFLDAFSTYRHQLGLRACSINLGVIEDVGYVSRNEKIASLLNAQRWANINESLLHKIFRFSIFQQEAVPLNPSSCPQLITGIPVPLDPESSFFRQGKLHDARFSALSFSNSKGLPAERHGRSLDTQNLLNLLKSEADHEAVLTAATQLVNHQFMKSLSMDAPMEPSKPLSGYGIDSLVAVEFKNWARQELGVEVTILEVINAKTLTTLSEGILAKMFPSS